PVGIVEHVFGEQQSAFILQERTPEALVRLLHQMLDDRVLLQRLSDENLRQIRNWEWKDKLNGWLELFKNAEKSHADKPTLKKEYLCARIQKALTDREVQAAKKAKASAEKDVASAKKIAASARKDAKR